MAKTLSQEAKAQYLKNPRRCPFCCSLNISSESQFSGEGDFGDPSKIYVVMYCNDCDELWEDEYKLVAVKSRKELEMEADG